MAASGQVGWFDPPEVVRLRVQHRCTMCHKHCLVPCTLTAAEFEAMVRAATPGPSPVGEGDGAHRTPEGGPSY